MNYRDIPTYILYYFICITNLYIDVPVLTNMKQIFQTEIEQVPEVQLERSIGNLFEEFLTSKNRLAEFDNFAQRTLIAIDGEVVRSTSGFPAKIAEILKLIVKPTQEVRFQPILAGG